MDNDFEQPEPNDDFVEEIPLNLSSDPTPEETLEHTVEPEIECDPSQSDVQIDVEVNYVQAEVTINSEKQAEESPIDQFVGPNEPEPSAPSVSANPNTNQSSGLPASAPVETPPHQPARTARVPRPQQPNSAPSANAPSPPHITGDFPLSFTDAAKGNTGKLSEAAVLTLLDKITGLVKESRAGDQYTVHVNEAGQTQIGPKQQYSDKAIPVPPISPDLRDRSPSDEEIILSEPLDNPPEKDIWESVDAAYEWFYRDLYEEEQTFAITLAFFSGASQSDVLQAHKYVKQILEARETNYGAGFDGQKSLFSTPLPNLMKATHSEFMNAYLLSNAGFMPVRGISFRDPGAVPSMLEMLAKYYSEHLVKLLPLVIAVAWDRDGSWGAYARKRASTTLGLLARTDFDIIKSMVLDKWVRTGLVEPRLRYATATVLSTIYTADGMYNRNIYTLARQWAGTKSNPSFVMTAIVVSSQMVTHNFKDYLEVLKNIIMYDQTLYLEDLGAAIISIYQDLREDYNNCRNAVHFIEKLVEWTSSPHEGLRIGALFLSLQLMAFTLDKDARIFPGEWELWDLPAKYRGTSQEDVQQVRLSYRVAINRILTQALSGPPLIVRLTNTILEELICVASSKPTYKVFVRYIFTDLCCSSEEKKSARLVWDWLKLWAKAPRLAHYHPYILELIEYIRPRRPQQEN